MPMTTCNESSATSQDTQPLDNKQSADFKPKLNIKYRTSNTNKRAEAQVAYLKGVTSPTVLAQRFGVSRNTIMTWKAKDHWDDNALLADHQLLGREAGRLAVERQGRLAGIRSNIAEVDRQIASGAVKPKSLEGLIRAKTDLIKIEQLLLGQATSRQERAVIVWRPTAGERIARPVAAEILADDTGIPGRINSQGTSGRSETVTAGDGAPAPGSTTPGIEAPGNPANAGLSRGPVRDQDTRIEQPIENHRGKVENTLAAPGNTTPSGSPAANSPAEGSDTPGQPAPATRDIRLADGTIKTVLAGRVRPHTVLAPGNGTREERRRKQVGPSQ